MRALVRLVGKRVELEPIVDIEGGRIRAARWRARGADLGTQFIVEVGVRAEPGRVVTMAHWGSTSTRKP